MLDVFRFAWFAARTFFGVIALVLAAYVALDLFVSVLKGGDVQQGNRPMTTARTARPTAPSCVRRVDHDFPADSATPICQISARVQRDP